MRNKYVKAKVCRLFPSTETTQTQMCRQDKSIDFTIAPSNPDHRLRALTSLYLASEENVPLPSAHKACNHVRLTQ
jgi:hypothetical protein